jgi:ribosomal protein S18 acetylase RimI-like enzyme
VTADAIREGVDADIERCVALAVLAAPERSSSEWRESLGRDVDSLEHLLVVGETAGAIVGYGRARLFEPAPDSPADTAPCGYYLTGVFVVPGERGAGLGTALTRARLDWIGELANEAWYFANARNTASIELHRRLGFEEISRRFSFPGLTFDGGEGILFRARL